MSSITPIELTTLVATTGKVELGNKCDVWRGQVVTHSGRWIEAYIKHLPPRALFVECVSALIGRAIGLAVPRPLLVKAQAVKLPQTDLSRGDILFGSVDAEYPSLQQLVTVEMAYEKLREWPAALNAGCFDEWIANADRHHGNILYSGTNAFTLIDHSHAIPANQDDSTPLNHNTFFKLIAPANLDNKSRQKILHSAKKNLPPLLKLSMEQWEKLTLSDNYVTRDDTTKVITFLQNRLTVLAALVSHQLGDRQQDLYAKIK